MNDPSQRRDFLRLSGAGLAGVALPLRAAQAQTSSQIGTSGIYDAKAFGATGDGRTIDTPAINRAVEAAS